MRITRTLVRACTLVAVLATLVAQSAMAQNWPNFGANNSNTASTWNWLIWPWNVPNLHPSWVFTTGGDVSARASVVNGVVYFPDWAGNLFALREDTGKLLWSHQLSDYGLAAGTVSRSTPTYDHGVLYVGTQYNQAACGQNGCSTGWLLAIDARTGNLIWKVQPVPTSASNPFPVITASPVIDGGVVYVGMTSNEEAAAGYQPGYVCCSVVGSVLALRAKDGSTLWQTPMAPQGYSGANIWGSNPVLDSGRHLLYVSTGDNYSHPTANAPSANPNETFSQCINDPNYGNEAACLAPNDYVDAIVALDTRTGAVKWASRQLYWHQPYASDGSDDFNVACIFGPPANCPANVPSAPPFVETQGPDYDFGTAANEITYFDSHFHPRTIIGAGQKSGIYYAFDPDTGATLWHTQVGPGSSLGGMEWGTASDGFRIYVAISNFYGIPYGPNYQWKAGSWAALDPATGAILWQTPDPNGAIDLGPVAASNGVVYAGSMAGTPTSQNMVALDAWSGKILWSYASGGSVISGATIADGKVYWGSGYTHLPIPGFVGNNKFYAFSPF